MSFDRFKADAPTAPINTTWKADDGSIFFADGTWIRVGDRLKADVIVGKHAAEVDELRGKLDDVWMSIGCARGQRSTQYCAEAAQRDEVITKLLAMLEPDGRNADYAAVELHARARAIAGRTE